jgi:hypothetical protein
MKIDIIVEEDKTHSVRIPGGFESTSIKGLSAVQAVDIQRAIEGAFQWGKGAGIQESIQALHRLNQPK